MSITYNIYNKIRLFPEWRVSDSPLFLVLICAFMIGLIYTLNIFDWGFISGMGRYWDYLQLYDVDRATALIGWRYFAHDEWRFPLFFVPMLGYPEGTNIIFTDSIPFIAAIFKLVFKMTGWKFNYFGFWMFLCYILQGMSVALLLYSLGVRFWLANLCGVLIALCAPILILRYGHGALSGHFIIIVSLWTYFILVKNPDRRWAWCVLLAVLALSVLITAYFFVMVAAILMATVFELLHRKQLSFHIAGAIFITACFLIIGVMFLAGLIGRGAVSPFGGLFGYYSMNMIAPFFGYEDSYMQRLFGPVIIDATGGQYEGFNYLGFGTILLACLVLFLKGKDVLQSIWSHPMLTMVLIGLSIFSFSNKVYFGNTEILHYPLPNILMEIGHSFRSSGRMFWPLYYVVMCGFIAHVWRHFWPYAALIILMMVATVQYIESESLRSSIAALSIKVNDPQFLDEDSVKLINQASKLFFVPSFYCTKDDPEWPRPSSWRGVTQEIIQFASYRAIPSNSIAFNRGKKDCLSENQSLSKEKLEIGTLYILRRQPELSSLEHFQHSENCIIKEPAILCAEFIPSFSRNKIFLNEK